MHYPRTDALGGGSRLREGSGWWQHGQQRRLFPHLGHEMREARRVQREEESLAELHGPCVGPPSLGCHSWPLSSALKASIPSPHPQAALILDPATCLVTHATLPTSRVSSLLPRLRTVVTSPGPLGQSLCPLPPGLHLVSSPARVLSVTSGPARPLASPLP